jgi:superfamily II DNA/RNA helicase
MLYRNIIVTAFATTWSILLSQNLCTSFSINQHPISIPRVSSIHNGRRILPSSSSSCIHSSPSNIEEDEALARTKKQLEIMKGKSKASSYNNNHNNNVSDDSSANNDEGNAEEKEEMYQQFVKKPANTLKEELRALKLPAKGRKPDLARRLVDYHTSSTDVNMNANGNAIAHDNDVVEEKEPEILEPVVPEQWQNHDDPSTKNIPPISKFANLQLSDTAGIALANAGFTKPTGIQATALPLLAKQRESLIIHAETGSGKTLTYLLPITETLWKEHDNLDGSASSSSSSYALILTPTRELAAQVAGVASVLSPPNSVRLVTTPTNLIRETYESKEKSESEFGGRFDSVIGSGQGGGTKIIVGSAKSILISLFGDSKMPAPPTSKPEAKAFLKGVKYLVMDEVDRLLDVKKTRGKTSKYYKKHEKPTATIASSIARMTLGQAQIVAASATIGRPMRRELARILGLTPDECPQVIRGPTTSNGGDDSDLSSRAITLPKTLQHYVLPCEGSTTGSLLTAAAFLVKNLPPLGNNRGRRILFVVSKGCGIKLRDALGALSHFGVKPEPKSLLDVMEANGTDNLIEKYRDISGSSGLGERSTSSVSFSQSEGYLLVSAEDTVRGIHLDDLDTVVIVGRPKGPDEYLHVAGRAGRAGKSGKVVSVVSYEQASGLSGWESMLGINFSPIDESEVRAVL